MNLRIYGTNSGAWVLLVLLMVTGPALAQAGNDGAARSAGDVAAEYVALAGSEGVTGEDWFALGRRARESGDFVTAGRALDQAATTLPGPRIALERARLRVVEGRADDAVTILAGLAANGFPGVSLVTSDPVLGSLAGMDAFDDVVESMRRSTYPCLYDEVFREFDFWLGDWEVHQANGQFAGTNSIRREEAGCVLTEHWTSASGGTGSSINYVDKTTGEWVQVWNSENGGQIYIRGGLTPDGMLLEGHLHSVGTGTTTPFRGLWTPLEDGRVRQYFEQSVDGGQSWSSWFEGFYTRKSETNDE
jgi:hypothetical protein